MSRNLQWDHYGCFSIFKLAIQFSSWTDDNFLLEQFSVWTDDKEVTVFSFSNLMTSWWNSEIHQCHLSSNDSACHLGQSVFPLDDLPSIVRIKVKRTGVPSDIKMCLYAGDVSPNQDMTALQLGSGSGWTDLNTRNFLLQSTSSLDQVPCMKASSQWTPHSKWIASVLSLLSYLIPKRKTRQYVSPAESTMYKQRGVSLDG